MVTSQNYMPQRSNGWEKLVQIEGQRIEFLASCVCFEWPEPIPPMHASIFPGLIVFPVQCDVKEKGQQASNKCFRWEGHIDHIVELQKQLRHLIITHTTKEENSFDWSWKTIEVIYQARDRTEKLCTHLASVWTGP